MHLEPLGDRALLLHLGDTIDEATRARVQAAHAAIARVRIPGVTDLVPAYASIAVHYDPAHVVPHVVTRAGVPAAPVMLASATPRAILAALLERALADAPMAVDAAARLVEIPVLYGGDGGPDLDAVAQGHRLAREAVIALHVTATYVVHMIGFVPGFPYLGGLDPRLATPRREVPRTRVPAGSVGIGGAQTGVYPLESPGGWQLIGRTPLRLFDASRAEPALLRAGDRVRFRAIDAATYDAMEREA